MSKFNANRILSKVMTFGDNLAGHSARKYSNTAAALRNAPNMGIKGITSTAVRDAERRARVAKGRSFQTRVKTGIGTGLALGGGFLGLHKYHQHKDNKILERIDSMYKKD